MEIFWTMLASQDRKRIREYIAEQNLMAAIELDERIGYSASSLAGQPYKGRNGRVEGTRELVIHPHFVLVYEVDSQWGKVYILRVIYYEKRGNAENYIKEAKYDMAVGHLLLKSFWANEAVFQMMMLSYNLFLLFKFDSLDSSEYRQQIKTFRLKYVFLAAKIIKTARYVIMKLSENYPYKGVYEKCLV